MCGHRHLEEKMASCDIGVRNRDLSNAKPAVKNAIKIGTTSCLIVIGHKDRLKKGKG